MKATVKLAKNYPITDYNNVVWWSSNDARNNAFDNWSGGVTTLENVSTVDFKKSEFRCQLDYTASLDFNYMCIIQNSRRFYCFIRNVDWVSNTNMAIIKFDIDYWSTYQHDIDLQKCLVIREHVANDTFGLHIIDEGLPTCETTSFTTNTDINFSAYNIAIALQDTSFITLDNEDAYPPIIENTVTNYVNGTIIVDVKGKSLEELMEILEMIGKTKSIIGVYMLPTVSDYDTVLGWIDAPAPYGETYVTVLSPTTHAQTNINRTISKPNSFDGYTPKNNKCFCYPYCYSVVSNQNGNSVIGRFEYSDNNNHSISVSAYAPVGLGSNSYAYLKNYKGYEKNLDYSVVGDTNTLIPYNTDTYATYYGANYSAINNNIRNLENNMLISGAQGVSNLVSGGVGTLPSTITNIYNSYNNALNYEASLKDIARQSDTTHGTFTGKASLLEFMQGFKLKTMQVPRENIEMIDNYFSMYGYKVNVCKKPQFNSRSIFNYVKTGGCNATGSCPQIALDTVKAMFDNGVTIWHGLNNVYNYDFSANSL